MYVSSVNGVEFSVKIAVEHGSTVVRVKVAISVMSAFVPVVPVI